ncbi:hypothetical protein [Brevundimonas sp. PAMC22021]|uniref:hypothetical protein n=1 Tax=Brevundimonas sp. PAMC22021 TaxID=2861285 RepID=UPI001C631508|nr:hypothetical protein [Brevundimonas sp. PAMC22021]QYF85652.1 hypothetical protein KY493_07095 [Brevundimonas sp. PAMC22021]
MRSWSWAKINAGAANIGPGVSAANHQRLTTATGLARVPASQATSPSTWYAASGQVNNLLQLARAIIRHIAK